ncbi:response regulator transcription factor [Nocardioides sp. GY 10127]|uniref:LuxR C-terminal-related transcriptional regulator n=1 Tax=Nocardioides sp. GY 10127 TaxID=2569762 RepID=UPI0010A75ACC|nr:response regulator transcription factor [Nocardioides sp. GY 10127]TIC81848.1 response regulator transcription factor [Nocardioides sp. GY 10127]
MASPHAELVVLVEDHQLFAEALELALQLRGHTVNRVLPAEASSVRGLVDEVLRRRPGLVMLDLDLGPVGNGVTAVGPLVQAGVDVIVVTGEHDELRWGECLAAGARTVLPKSSSLPSIMSVVRRVMAGVPVMEVAERERLLGAARRRQVQELATLQRLQLLSPRERVVLGHLMAGRTVTEVAAAETLSPATVRTQVKSILGKLEVSSQVAAVGMAYGVGWSAPR